MTQKPLKMKTSKEGKLFSFDFKGIFLMEKTKITEQILMGNFFFFF